MPAVAFPRPATTLNAPFNNTWLAKQYLDQPYSAINARRTAQGQRCGCCNRNPRSGELCEIVLDSRRDLTAKIGIGRCHFDFFRSALEALLFAEIAGAHPFRAARILKLQSAITLLTRNLK